ncbi:MAG: GNAT family N-acetyltransferase [Coriobacteriales bacterium]|nr:GNAT family N-acetyltransferase [Coriobacteriales bacterium]
MEYAIRDMERHEWPLLEDFLYEAIYVPEDFIGDVPRSVVYEDPKCRAAFEGFGELPDDRAVVATLGDAVVGACWVRTTDEYGHIDDETPSFSISLRKPYRGKGIGGALMRAMLDELSEAGYARCSLSVQKENPALRLYERMGFRIVSEGFDESEWLMVCRLDRRASLELRRLSEDDVPTFVEMRITQLLEEGASETVDLRPALGEYYARHLKDGSFVSWLALDGKRIVATSGISVVEKPPYFACPTGKIALVSSMYTEPQYRRQGIARDLLCRVLDEAKACGCGMAQISASDAGVPLYRTLGFVANPNFYQIGLSDLGGNR